MTVGAHGCARLQGANTLCTGDLRKRSHVLRLAHDSFAAITLQSTSLKIIFCVKIALTAKGQNVANK